MTVPLFVAMVVAFYALFVVLVALDYAERRKKTKESGAGEAPSQAATS